MPLKISIIRHYNHKNNEEKLFSTASPSLQSHSWGNEQSKTGETDDLLAGSKSQKKRKVTLVKCIPSIVKYFLHLYNSTST